MKNKYTLQYKVVFQDYNYHEPSYEFGVNQVNY